MIYTWYEYPDYEYKLIDFWSPHRYPGWSETLGWLMSLAVVVPIIVGAIVAICMAPSSNIREVCTNVIVVVCSKDC